MNQPSSLVRFAGFPLISIALFGVYGFIVFNWYEGRLPWWMALGAVLASGRTLAAMGRMRSYKAWLAQWNAVGAEEKPSSRVRKGRGSGWARVTVAVLFVVIVPVAMPPMTEANRSLLITLTLLANVAGLYLVFIFIRAIVRRMAKRRKTARVESGSVVTWAVGCASSSPSRAEVERELPGYCVELLRRNAQEASANDAGSHFERAWSSEG